MIRSERSLFSKSYLALTGLGTPSEFSRDSALVPQLDRTRDASFELVNPSLELLSSSSQAEVDDPSGVIPLLDNSVKTDGSHFTEIPTLSPGPSSSKVNAQDILAIPNAVNFHDRDWLQEAPNRLGDENHRQVDISQNAESGQQRQKRPLDPYVEDVPESTLHYPATSRDHRSYTREEPTLGYEDHHPVETATLIRNLAKGVVAQLTAVALREKIDYSLCVRGDPLSRQTQEKNQSESRPLDSSNNSRLRTIVRNDPIDELDHSEQASPEEQSELERHHNKTSNKTAEIQIEQALHAVLEQLRLHGQKAQSKKTDKASESSEDSGQQVDFKCDFCVKTFQSRPLFK